MKYHEIHYFDSFFVMSNPILLEISTRPFLQILSEKYSRPINKIIDIPESVFDEWKQMGFEWIWMMGIWELGQYGLNLDRTSPKKKSDYDKLLPDWTSDDVIGSPYSIVSYTINPELGKEEDIAWLRKQLNQRGMKLMLDFVPNHTAIDSIELTKEKKRDFYIHFPDNMSLSEAHMTEEQFNQKYGPNKIAYGCASTNWKPLNETEAETVNLSLKPWIDVAQLNYMNPELRKSRIEILLKIASQSDGIRCDVADIIFNRFFWKKWQFELENTGYKLLKTEFWEDAISQVKSKFNNCVFLAEANYDYNESFKKCGFDYVYERLIIREIEKKDSVNLSQIKKVINDPDVGRYAHTIENHDEKRSIETCSNNPLKEHSAAVLSLTLPGIHFVNQDQWCGYKREIGVQLRRAVKEKPNEEFVTFYRKLFDILKLDVLKNGKFSVNDEKCFSHQSDILSWKYQLDGNSVAVFVNFSDSPIDVTYKFSDADKNINEVADLFNDKMIKLDKPNEFNLHLDQYNYILIKY